MSEKKITAIVIDDSAVVRRHLADTLTAGGIEVIATAGDPLFAWPKMQARWPDVVVLDVEMPRMDGISFLRKVMAERPTPVVMCSTLTAAGAATTLQALAEGAVSFVTKPKMGLRDFLVDSSNGLVAAVRAASQANVGQLARRASVASGAAGAAATVAAPTAGTSAGAARAPLPVPRPFGGALHETTDRVIAIGSSTGGVQAIEAVLTKLPRTTPGVVIVQHMPETFTPAFAARLDGLCAMEVKEARDGDRVIPGRVLIAPGGRHMQLQRNGAQYVVAVRDGPLVNRHKPSVDVLFKSVAQHAGRNALGVILTGMGDDGARGLLEMRQAGAVTAAQDEASCVVYGMPREAARMGAADHVLGLADIGPWIARTASSETLAAG
ncbi:MAG: chemotaxis response regulator protein-glutamate methylesterase [Burkholderiales bacterium]|nr:chemotaxis response regulator protein-glutamate methylesterase [Burkholderiales bacterium]